MLRGSAAAVFILFFPIGSFCQQSSPIGPSSQQTVVSTASSCDRPACCCATAASSGPSQAPWYATLERPDWWVAIIATLTGLAVAWQSFETRRATQAMRASNRATAQSQRARLSIHHEHREIQFGSRKERVFQLFARNFGLSIAEIIEIDTKLAHFGPEVFEHFETMDFADPTSNIFSEPKILSPGDRWMFADLTMGAVVEPGCESETEAGRRIPVWYGWVKFRDFAGDVHRRKFFFMYSGREQTFLEVGPRGWNLED